MCGWIEEEREIEAGRQCFEPIQTDRLAGFIVGGGVTIYSDDK